MKHLLTAVFLMASIVPAIAQRDALIDHNDKWNLNTKFDAGYTDIADDSAFLGGLSVGGLLNDSFGFGIRARGLADSIDDSLVIGTVERLDFWYGGLFVEYLFGSENLVYLSTDITVAYGELDSSFADSEMYVAEPGLNLYVNITETLMFGLGASYRFVSNSQIPGVDDGDLSDVTWNASLRFTQF